MSAAELGADTVGLPTIPGLRPGLSRETGRRLEDSVNPAVRAVSARAPSAATTTAERPGAIPPAEVPVSEGALAAAAAFMAVVDTAAGGGNHGFVMLPVELEIERWR